MYKIRFVLLACFVINAYAEDNEVACDPNKNIFYHTIRIEDNVQCKDVAANKIKIEEFSQKINNKLINELTSKCMPYIKSNGLQPFSVNKSNVNDCEKLTACFEEIDLEIEKTDLNLSCSLKSMDNLLSTARYKTRVKKALNSNVELNLNILKQFVSGLMPASALTFDESKHGCQMKEAKPDCMSSVEGMSWSLIADTYESVRLEKQNEWLLKAEEKYKAFGPKFTELMQYNVVMNFNTNRNNGQLKQPALMQTGVLDNQVEQTLIKTQYAIMQEIQRKNDNELRDLLKPICDELKVDYDVELMALKNSKKKFDRNDFLNHILKKAHNDSNCSETSFDEQRICEKVVQNFKNPERELRPVIELKSHISDKLTNPKESKDYVKYNLENIIGKSPVPNYGFFAKSIMDDYLNISEQYKICAYNYSSKAFSGAVNGVSADKRWENFRTASNKMAKQVQVEIQKDKASGATNLASTMESSGSESIRSLSKEYRNYGDKLNSSLYISSENGLKKIDDINGLTNKGIGAQDASIGTSSNQPSSNLGTGTSQISSQLYDGVNSKSNGLNNTGRMNNYAQPNFDSFSEQGSTASSTSAINKKLDELAEKEKALRKKADEKTITSAESEEMKELRRQIEELKTQLSSQGTKKDVLGNKLIGANSSSAAAGPSPSPTPSVKPGQMYATSSSRGEARGSDSGSDRSGSSKGYDEVSMGGADRSTASARALGGSGAAGKGSDAKGVRSFGVVLTSNGEVTEDLAKIVENPKDTDILMLFEKSKGKPFLIKENGALVQVIAELDDKGNPILENGKPKLKKVKLSKEAERLVAKEINVIRESKTVRDTARLRDLKKVTVEGMK